MARLMRLNKLLLFAIILSVLWAIGMAIHTHNDSMERANGAADFAEGVCKDTQMVQHNTDISSCTLKRQESLALYTEQEPLNSIMAGIVPLPFLWMAGFVLLYIYRIQRAGYRSVVHWSIYGRGKKSFVVFTWIFTSIVLLFGLTNYLNLITDKRVPVTVGGGLYIYRDNDNNYADVEGTWTRSGRDEGSAIAFPLQRSKITCWRQTGHCVESRAYVFNDLMAVDTDNFDIKSWTQDTLTFVNEQMCASETYTVDFANKSVTGGGHRTNDQRPYCNMNGGLIKNPEQNWQYQMVDGMKVYWEEHKKARPWLLRFIQACFGN